LVDALLIELVHLIVGHENLGRALGDRVLQQRVHRLDLTTILLGRGLDLGVGLIA
jgi:hypothetical protein